jgi:exodeoxyribonuclease V beta subunit
MQQELSERSVPCVLYNAGYLFESHEARELERVLTGIARPNDERHVKAALATDIMGLTGKDLSELSTYETQWEKRLMAFRNYHEMCNRDGFFRMFRQLMVQEHVKERLIRLPNGERRLTNLLHLAEELHRQSGETNLGMRGLGKWLAEQIHPASPNLEEHLLRLETDEDAVKILTIHKSKGLEYPIVFCPFNWGNSDVQGNEVMFHDYQDAMQLKLDLGSQYQEIHRKYASEECLAENMRLLYVALTRAKNRCYFVWGGFKGAETSAPAYFFHNRDPQQGQDIIQTTKENFKALSDDDILNDLKRYENLSGDTILVCEVPEEEPIFYGPRSVSLKVPLFHRTFADQVDQEWRVTSFSSLVSGRMHEPEFPDSDEFAFDRQEIPRPQSERFDHFILPAGAKTGSMLHDILEHLDFTNVDDLTLESVVFEKIKAYGYDAQWHAPICTMMQNVLSVPLEPDRNGFTLSHVQKKDRVSELGFYFPLRPISKELLKQMFSEFGSQELSNNFPMIIEDLTFSPVQGFMKGFIDLVFCHNERFYLVDWKSNLLGVDPEGYRRDNLQWVMEKNYYILQYHIYTLALHQYLSVRVPGYRYEKHFGGVYYIFLRGVEPALGPSYGIYYDRPSVRIIQEMHTRLLQWIN